MQDSDSAVLHNIFFFIFYIWKYYTGLVFDHNVIIRVGYNLLLVNDSVWPLLSVDTVTMTVLGFHLPVMKIRW